MRSTPTNKKYPKKKTHCHAVAQSEAVTTPDDTEPQHKQRKTMEKEPKEVDAARQGGVWHSQYGNKSTISVVASTKEEPSANEVARKYWYYWPSEREQTSRAKREAVEQVVIFGAQKSAKKCGCLRCMVRLDESCNVARDDEHSTPITLE